jgi:hypothetical protein
MSGYEAAFEDALLCVDHANRVSRLGRLCRHVDNARGACTCRYSMLAASLRNFYSGATIKREQRPSSSRMTIMKRDWRTIAGQSPGA